VGQGFAQHVGQALARALARHLHQAQLREAADRGARAVARELLAELGQHGLLVLLARHVDEVDDDDAAQVAQAQLPRDGAGGLEVGLEDGVVEVARADEAAGVDVHRGQRLGLVDDQVAAALEVHAPRQRAHDLLLDAEQVEDRPLAACTAAAWPPPRACRSGRTGLQRVVLHLRVDADGLRLLVGQVAQHALGQAQVLVQQVPAARFARARGSCAQALRR
jgi:hypothetical protein